MSKDDELCIMALLIIVTVLAISIPLVFTMNRDSCDDETIIGEREVISLREERLSIIKHYYYALLNDSKEYLINETDFFALEAGMIVNLTSCGNILY